MPKIFPAMKAVIVNDEKFLIIRQKIGETAIWDLPGGKIEYDENPYDALFREVKEETCLQIEIIKPLGVFWYYRIENKDQVICNTFLCKIKDNNFIIKNSGVGDKIDEFKWVTKKEFLSGVYNESPESLKRLIETLKI